MTLVENNLFLCMKLRFDIFVHGVLHLIQSRYLHLDVPLSRQMH